MNNHRLAVRKEQLHSMCPLSVVKSLDRGHHFCYKTPGSAKLTGGAPGLQIRCGAVKAVPGGFDSHALPPLAAQKTPGLSSGVIYLAGNSRSIIDMPLGSTGINECQIPLNTVFDNHIQLIKYCKELVCVS